MRSSIVGGLLISQTLHEADAITRQSLRTRVGKGASFAAEGEEVALVRLSPAQRSTTPRNGPKGSSNMMVLGDILDPPNTGFSFPLCCLREKEDVATSGEAGCCWATQSPKLLGGCVCLGRKFWSGPPDQKERKGRGKEKRRQDKTKPTVWTQILAPSLTN